MMATKGSEWCAGGCLAGGNKQAIPQAVFQVILTTEGSEWCAGACLARGNEQAMSQAEGKGGLGRRERVRQMGAGQGGAVAERLFGTVQVGTEPAQAGIRKAAAHSG